MSPLPKADAILQVRAAPRHQARAGLGGGADSPILETVQRRLLL
jgi:hypothetical protein